MKLIGDGAEDYIGHAIDFYKRVAKQGRLRADTSIDNALIRADTQKQEALVLMLVSEYALFSQDPSTGQFFSLFLDAVPQAWPTFDALLPAMPLFYPVFPDELLVPAYDRLRIRVEGATTHHREVMFTSPILSSYGESLSWTGLALHFNPETEHYWCLTRYVLNGYLDPYVNNTKSKIVLFDDSNQIGEVTFQSNNVFPACRLAKEGITYRRVKGSDMDKMFLCQIDDVAYSAQVYELVETAGVFEAVPLGLPDLPVGGRYGAGMGPDYTDLGTFGRHVDHVYDIFSSERSLHYYVVKSVADTAVAYHVAGAGYAYPNDIQFFPGTSLSVEKRLRSDLTLVATYNLTPTSIDHLCQDVAPIAQSIQGANIQVNGYSTGTAIITRFVPMGTGFVLVAADGTEYPVLPVLACHQDYFFDSVLGYTARGVYLDALVNDPEGTYATNPEGTFNRNVFQQPALLWLGTPPPGFDGYTWAGVDAAGLKITEAAGTLANDFGIGGMRRFASAVSDSDSALLLMNPFYGNAAGAGVSEATASESNNNRVISVRLVDVDATTTPVVRLERIQSQDQAIVMFDI